MSNSANRRNLSRMAERLGITYDEAILKFYGVKSLSEIDKNLLWSLKGKPHTMGRRVGKNKRKVKDKKFRDGFFGSNTESFWKRPLHIHDPRESGLDFG